MDWLDYREKLQIGFNDEDKVKYFVTKILNALNGIANDRRGFDISYHEYFKFCDMTATTLMPNETYLKCFNEIIETIKGHQRKLEDFLSYYIAFVNSIANTDSRKSFIEIAIRKMDESHIPYEMLEDEGNYFIFPKGAKELDDALVSDVLFWLRDYPKTRDTYTIALRQYSEGIYIRDVADNLRRSLEIFLQEFLRNEKNLDNNISEICKYLSNFNVVPEISSFYHDIASKYKNINDKYAKHNDGIDSKVLEFLLYQTGLLIRMPIVACYEL